MSKPNTTRITIDLDADLGVAVAKAAAEVGMTVEDLIGDCVSQHCETALRYRVLIQRQNDVDEALLELARLVGRLSAGPHEPPENICSHHPADSE